MLELTRRIYPMHLTETSTLTTKPRIIYRNAYQSPEFAIESTHLDFTIVNEEEVVVINTMVIERIDPDSTVQLLLDGEGLELLNVLLDEKVLTEKDYQLNTESLIIHSTPSRFTLTITNKINPKANTLLSGLYYADGLFCTQCESSGFRRITYFLDHPDVLTRFTVRINANREKYPTLLSNGNCIEQNVDSVTWEDPFKKPAYLFALVVGDLAHVKDTFTTMSGRTVTLEIYVDHGNEDKCQHAMESLKNSMRWDEEKFGLEYDLDIYMIVAVRSFNMGAMENKGLNIFNAKYVLARPESATDADFIAIERVIGHEYFHNWTGNRVTCRDWFQLSLKEGLTVFRDQRFCQDIQESSVYRIQDIKTLRSHQFSEDASPMAHPVRPESYIEINNFYTMTVYNKGAEVIRMQETLLGQDGFRKGMDLYFKRHDGQAVTIDDFVKAMEDANNRDLTQFKRWYSQSGTPEIKAQSTYDEKKQRFTLTLSQSCPPTPGQPTKEPFHIPVAIALWSDKGEAISIPTTVLELKEATQTWTWEQITVKPTVSLLGNFSAPVKLDIDYTDAELQLLIKAETDGFSRWEAIQRVVYQSFLTLVKQYHTHGEAPSQLPALLLDVFHQILHNHTIDPLSKAELLTLPGFLECTQPVISCIGYIDVDAIEMTRDFLSKSLGLALYDELLSTYKNLDQKSSSEMNARAFGERKLKNVCLSYLAATQKSEANKLALTQLTQAQNMTDELAALMNLMNFDEATRDQASDIFYKKWQNNDLVLDKWFAAQAASVLPSTLDNVEKLLWHPKFDRNNPNKVKALLGTFWQNNPRYFHCLDGRGYELFVAQILGFDKNNAFISASLARSMMNWKLFDGQHQQLMQEALKTIIKEAVSKDLYEIVSKSL